jgi:hypothetical protein
MDKWKYIGISDRDQPCLEKLKKITKTSVRTDGRAPEFDQTGNFLTPFNSTSLLTTGYNISVLHDAKHCSLLLHNIIPIFFYNY